MKSFKEHVNEVVLSESKMAALHDLITQGKSAKEIAKELKLDLKTIEALMKGFKEHLELSEGITIGKSYDILQYDSGSNTKRKQTVKVIDYIKKSGNKDIVVYTDNKGKEKKMPAGQFLSLTGRKSVSFGAR